MVQNEQNPLKNPVGQDWSAAQFRDLFDLEEIQRVQDSFSKATGVSSLITDPEGNPITRPSNFPRLCRMIRNTSKGKTDCIQAVSCLGLSNSPGLTVGRCFHGQLFNGRTGFDVGGQIVGNWLVGQVTDDSLDEEQLLDYASTLGLDKRETIQAVHELPRMSKQRFNDICEALHLLCNQLSALALQNLQQRIYIAKLQHIQSELQESEERYRALVQRSSEAILLIDPDTRKVIEANHHFREMLGYTETELQEMTAYDIVVDEKTSVDRYYEEVLPMNNELPVESRSFRHRDGHIVEVERSGTMVHLNGKKVYMVTARDVTDRKFIEEKMNFLSFHDILTGLYNRTYFEEELTRLECRRGGSVGLILFDLDGLKLVNDSFGHEHGDNLLMQTAELIQGCFRESDVVARIGGDEFAVVIQGTSAEGLESVVARVYQDVTN